MDLRTLQRKAKELIDRRGGTTSLKEDAPKSCGTSQGPRQREWEGQASG
jgi:hypothetical protein